MILDMDSGRKIDAIGTGLSQGQRDTHPELNNLINPSMSCQAVDDSLEIVFLERQLDKNNLHNGC